jgi:ABC-type sugar transport system ATPase subunit
MVNDRAIPLRTTRQAARLGIAYVPRERAAALFGWMSIRENFGMPTLNADVYGGWLAPRRTRKRFLKYADRLGVVHESPEQPITALSGGNQQKVVIARWLAAEPRVLVLNDPTRGIDLGTKRGLYTLLTELARSGHAIVMLSTELDEHVELMDRVLVFREHSLSRELLRKDLSRSALISGFFGGER